MLLSERQSVFCFSILETFATGYPNLKKTVVRKCYFLLPQGILSFFSFKGILQNTLLPV